MSLFKTVVFVGAVIALLPSDRENQRALQQTAVSFTAEARSFCEARPNICLSREDAWDVFKSKAAFAYELGSELLWGHQTYRPAQSYTQPYGQRTYRRQDDIGTLLQSDTGDL